MQLTPQQMTMLRKPFDDVGAFHGRSEEETIRLLGDIAQIYVTLARMNLRSKQESNINQ